MIKAKLLIFVLILFAESSFATEFPIKDCTEALKSKKSLSTLITFYNIPINYNDVFTDFRTLIDLKKRIINTIAKSKDPAAVDFLKSVIVGENRTKSFFSEALVGLYKINKDLAWNALDLLIKRKDLGRGGTIAIILVEFSKVARGEPALVAVIKKFQEKIISENKRNSFIEDQLKIALKNAGQSKAAQKLKAKQPKPTAPVIPVSNSPRYFEKISEKELNEKINLAWQENPLSKEYDSDSEIRYYSLLTSKIKDDLKKVKFQESNHIVNSKKIKITGLHTLENGLTYFGVFAAGDDEKGVFFIIYWDGKSLRAYIPQYGNTWNTKTKRIFTMDYEDSDDPNIRSRAGEFIYSSKISSEDLTMENIEINPALILEDILKRFQSR